MKSYSSQRKQNHKVAGGISLDENKADVRGAFALPQNPFGFVFEKLKKPSEKGFFTRPASRIMMVFGFSFFFSLFAASFMGRGLLIAVCITLASLAVLAVGFALLTFILKNDKKREIFKGQVMPAFVAVIAAFSFYTAKELFYYDPISRFDAKEAKLTLKTIDYPEYKNGYTLFKAKVENPWEYAELNGEKLNLYVMGETLYLEPDTLIEGSFPIEIPKDSAEGNRRGFSKSTGVLLNASANGTGEEIYKNYHVTKGKRELSFYIAALRKNIKDVFYQAPVEEDNAALMLGLSFGFKEEISPLVKYNFKLTGTSHLLSVSGMQTTLIAFAVFAALRKLRVSNKGSAVFTVAVLLVFIALTGFTKSVVRSGLMSIVVFSGYFFSREADPLNSLGLSLFIICAVNPYAVNDLGLMLSFGATWGLISVKPMLGGRKDKNSTKQQQKQPLVFRGLDKIKEALLVTFGATIPITPIMMAFFGTLSLISPIANLFMVFPATVVTVLSVIALILSFIPFMGAVSGIILIIASKVTGFLVFAAEKLSALPYASVDVRGNYLYFWVVGVAVFIAVWILIYRRFKLKAVLIFAVVLFAAGFSADKILNRNNLVVKAMKAGNSSSVIVKRGDEVGLICFGSRSGVQAALYELENMAVKSIDFVLVNSDDKAATEFKKLSGQFEIKRVLTTSGGGFYDSIAKAPYAFEAPEITAYSGEEMKINPFDKGELSVVMKDYKTVGVEYHGTSVIIFGEGEKLDLTENAERNYDLAFFTAAPPVGYEGISVKTAVLSCDADKLKFVSKAFNSGEFYNTSKSDVEIKISKDSYYWIAD